MLARASLVAFLVACGAPPKTKDPAQPRGIRAAGLPFSILDGRTGRQVDTQQFWDKLAAARVVCVGEDHPNPHHHWFQLEVMTHVAEHKPLALGMEMFQRPFQGVLDDYAAKQIGRASCRERV